VTSFEIKRSEAVAIVPMVLLILVFAFYPQFALRRSQSSIKTTIAAAHAQPALPGGPVQAAQVP
jgi:NADH:ubiquinone oxidoreductase subunit 4 (subunit M)